MVLASHPVASVILFAARPVGAARRISISSISKYRIIVLMVVVFPVPGPPVMISRPLFTASMTACLLQLIQFDLVSCFWILCQLCLDIGLRDIAARYSNRMQHAWLYLIPYSNSWAA